jgi:hypothetical protein
VQKLLQVLNYGQKLAHPLQIIVSDSSSDDPDGTNILQENFLIGGGFQI